MENKINQDIMEQVKQNVKSDPRAMMFGIMVDSALHLQRNLITFIEEAKKQGKSEVSISEMDAILHKSIEESFSGEDSFVSKLMKD